MYIALYYFDLFLAFILLILWGLAAYLVDRLPLARTARRLRVTAWLGFGLIVIAEVVAVLRLGVMLGMWASGWIFVRDRLVLAVPLLILPALAVLILSMPSLLRVFRTAREWSNGIDRAAASSPSLAVPLLASAVSAILSLYVGLYAPYPPYLRTAAVLAVIVVAVAALGWLRCLRRQGRARVPGGHVAPAFPWRVARATAVALITVILATGGLIAASRDSHLPDRYNMAADHGTMDYGGGPEITHTHAEDPFATSVSQLTGPLDREPDTRFTLSAQQTLITLASGEIIDAWTFNGQAPGPEIRVRQGDLVEVTLVNQDIADGVTIHWHGYDVPNAEDGVSGVTQDAVLPGGTYTYRFIATDPGTYWYHSHQASSEQVERGLFGPFVVEPAQSIPSGSLDTTVLFHSWRHGGGGATDALGLNDGLERRSVAPGTPVRLRLVNANSKSVTLDVSGVTYQVAAIDGTDLNDPTDLDGGSLEFAGGGRYDLTFTMPDTPVLIGTPELGILISRDGTGDPPPVRGGDTFDPLDYGTPAPTPFTSATDFDREFTLVLDNRLGFYDGRFVYGFTINGAFFPDTPMLMVSEGDLVKTTIINRSGQVHPMRLHGHHVLVLSRNGDDATDSPWWTDTLDVAPGDILEVAFVADNPGIWMDHCHNLRHAADGMTMHLAYEGVTTPYEVGRDSVNKPE